MHFSNQWKFWQVIFILFSTFVDTFLGSGSISACFFFFFLNESDKKL